MQILDQQVWVRLCISDALLSDACDAGLGSRAATPKCSVLQEQLGDVLKQIVGPYPHGLI